MLALETCAKGSGSMRLTFLLAYRVHFYCLLRPQSRSVLFRPSIPCSPFAQGLQSLRKKLPHSRSPPPTFVVHCPSVALCVQVFFEAQKGLEMCSSNELLLGRYL